MDWYQAVKMGDRGKRREALVPVIERLLAEAPAPLSTWDLAMAIAATGTQAPIHQAETVKRLSYDLTDIAPYFPKWCQRGEAVERYGKQVRPWVWMLAGRRVAPLPSIAEIEAALRPIIGQIAGERCRSLHSAFAGTILENDDMRGRIADFLFEEEHPFIYAELGVLYWAVGTEDASELLDKI